MKRTACILSMAIAFASSMALAEEPKLDALLVYGEGFWFSVKEPPGWTGDTEHAGDIRANVVFRRSSKRVEDVDGLIRVRINEKVDEDTAADLQADMDGYRQKFPKVQFEPFDVPHPNYRVLSKLFFVPGDFFEYVVYLNPGPGAPWLFSISMSKEKERATAEELAAFRQVVASIVFLPSKANKQEALSRCGVQSLSWRGAKYVD